MEDWFGRYADPERDGIAEPVCGRGQLCKLGPQANGQLTFHPAVAVDEHTRRK